jgi:hypothetical protein
MTTGRTIDGAFVRHDCAYRHLVCLTPDHDRASCAGKVQGNPRGGLWRG